MLIVAATVTAYGVVAATQATQDETAACSGTTVSGTVVAVDEAARELTIDTGESLCTVTLEEFDHPIVDLLGMYFSGLSLENLAQELEALEGCAVQDKASGKWTWAECSAVGAVEAMVIAENEDGTFQAQVAGKEVTISVADDEAAEILSEALGTLSVELELEGDGAVVQLGEDIAAYHEDGLGFGVLVKLYAMAADSGEPVAELIDAFQSGQDMGALFQQYGKPALLGVGHVRQADMGQPDDEPVEATAGAATGGADVQIGPTRGICNARAHGGKAQAKGLGEVTCP